MRYFDALRDLQAGFTSSSTGWRGLIGRGPAQVQPCTGCAGNDVRAVRLRVRRRGPQRSCTALDWVHCDSSAAELALRNARQRTKLPSCLSTKAKYSQHAILARIIGATENRSDSEGDEAKNRARKGGNTRDAWVLGGLVHSGAEISGQCLCGMPSLSASNPPMLAASSDMSWVFEALDRLSWHGRLSFLSFSG